MADTKLTLKLNSDSIVRAKNFSENSGISLSAMVEKFFDELTLKKSENKAEVKYSPLVNELSGIISLSTDFDYKAEYLEHLETKYE
ncbi:MAG: DUF6364 family protein [Treponema sp.]|nr:DUF6364 family protein [Treponema sp.]